jgi:glycosyltransferase involved in cell wall biosynthesis
LLNLPAFADRDRRDFLASATIVAQPSRVESLGLVLIEAWANRKPVIAADIEVSRELIKSSGGGVTVPFGNAERLADALAKMLGDPTGQESMGAGGLEKSMLYQGNTVWQRFAAEFEGVVRRS